ncbi:MAG: glycosyltransferase family 2 protein [Lachnospiraceae bacterium]|nr:glycosyltransferase family 2 protein [Lachnospiraceae bacterium]
MSNKLVIIPAFNEAGCIVNTVNDIIENAPDFDYVIINDCSRDDTYKLCLENGFNVVSLPINSGIGAAVQTGYLYAKRYGYEYAIQVDGDGQHDAAFLGTMARYMEEHNTGMLIGSRYIEKQGFQSSGLRRFGIKYFTLLIKILTGKKITDPTSGMRMVGRDIIEYFAEEYPKDYPEPETAVTIVKRGWSVEEIPVVMKERQAGTSSISPKRSIYYMIKVSLACIIAAMSS